MQAAYYQASLYMEVYFLCENCQYLDKNIRKAYICC